LFGFEGRLLHNEAFHQMHLENCTRRRQEESGSFI
jgi:hypothetical protein